MKFSQLSQRTHHLPTIFNVRVLCKYVKNSILHCPSCVNVGEWLKHQINIKRYSCWIVHPEKALSNGDSSSNSCCYCSNKSLFDTDDNKNQVDKIFKSFSSSYNKILVLEAIKSRIHLDIKIHRQKDVTNNTTATQ